MLSQYAEANGIEAGRIGGEEFMAVWPETEENKGEKVGNELRLAVAALNIPHAAAEAAKIVTISVGLFAVKLPNEYKTETIYALADKALYKAKAYGRNCCWKYCAASNSFIAIQ